MAQVAVQDVSFSSFDGTSGTVSHIVAAGEGLIVGVILEVTDEGKEVDTVVWDVATANESLTQDFSFNPTHGKLRIEVFRRTNPTAGNPLLVTVTNKQAQKTGVLCISVTNHDTTTMLADQQNDEGTASPGSVAPTQNADDLALCFAAWLATTSNFRKPLTVIGSCNIRRNLACGGKGV